MSFASASRASAHTHEVSERKRNRKKYASLDVKDAIIEQVSEKLRNHPLFKYPLIDGEPVSSQDKYEREIREKAHCLSSEEMMWDEFSHLTQGTADQVFEDREEDFANEQERASHHQREHRYLDDTCNLQIKLLLTSLKGKKRLVQAVKSVFAPDYGATHTALQVGDILLEWGQESLIIPEHVPNAEVLLQVDIRQHGSFHRGVSMQRQSLPSTTSEDETTQGAPSPGAAAMDGDEEEQEGARAIPIEFFMQVVDRKTDLLAALIQVVLKYNRKYYYHAGSRNCHTFLSDALSALETVCPQFEGKLGKFFDELKAGKVSEKAPHGYDSHSDLNAVVTLLEEEGTLGEKTLDDLQFFDSAYCYFHGQSSVCKEADCKMQLVKDLMRDKLKQAS